MVVLDQSANRVVPVGAIERIQICEVAAWPDPKDGAVAAHSPLVGCSVKTAIATQDQRGAGIGSIAAGEGMQVRQVTAGANPKDGAIVTNGTGGGRAVKIAVTALHELGNGACPGTSVE